MLIYCINKNFLKFSEEKLKKSSDWELLHATVCLFYEDLIAGRFSLRNGQMTILEHSSTRIFHRHQSDSKTLRLWQSYYSKSVSIFR